MSEPATALLSVRGEARATVAPDFVVLSGVLKATAGTKAAALEIAAAALRRLTADLGSLGAAPMTGDVPDAALAWLAHSATTEVEFDHDYETGRSGPTGRIHASVAMTVQVRAFELLERLGGVLATHEALSIHHVAWHVDPDNPSWPDVRAAAIRAAIAKGRDYATALGGSLDRVEHIADVGLLGNEHGSYLREASAAAAFRSGPEGLPDTPSLDPVPQELTAIIDARFVASVAAL